MTTQATRTTVSDVLAEIDAITQQAAERDRDAAGHLQAAEDAGLQAEQHAAAAQAAEQQRIGAINQRFHVLLRDLTTEVNDARQAAIDAIHRGEDCMDAWLRYRLVGARANGRWAVLGDRWTYLTGAQRRPDGPPIPELRVEPYERFLTATATDAEQAAWRHASLEASAELEALAPPTRPQRPGVKATDSR